MRIRNFVLFTVLLLVIQFSFARPWTPDDDAMTGIPDTSNVNISVEKLANGGLHLVFTHPNVKFENVTAGKRDWTFITMNGETRTWTVGKPVVPVMARPVLLPRTGNVELKIRSAEYIEYHNIDVLPQQPLPELTADEKDYVDKPFTIDNGCYSRDEWYPAHVAELSTPAIIRDARTSILSIEPVSVNPVTRTVRVYTRIDVETTPSGGVGVNELLSARDHTTPGFAQFYDEILGADELTETNANALPGAMMVICRNDAQVTGALTPYIDWRNRSGRITTLVTTTASTPEELKTLINSAYTTWNPAPEVVLLVGDGGSFGSYLLPSYSYSAGGYADHDMVCLVGNDMLADVFVCRWTCDNVQQLTIQINRSLGYERTPYMGPTGADTTWYRRGWAYAGTSHLTTSNRTAMWFALSMMQARGIPQSGLYYDEHNGSVDQNTINQRVNPGLLFWAHRVGYISEMSAGNVSGLTNGNKCYVGFNITCGTGEWYGTGVSGISEQAIRDGTTTAPAGALCSTSPQTGGTHPAHNICMATGTMYGLGVKNARQPSGMYYEGKYQLWRNFWANDSAQANNFIHWNNIMGDISVNMWTGVPHRMSVNIPQTIGLGQNRLVINVTQQFSQTPIEGVLVTAMKKNTTGTVETYARVVTDNTGTAILPLTNETTGNLYVTVIGNKVGQNLVPIIDTVSVANLSADAGIANVQLLDDNQNGRVGNNNGMANPGETIDLSILLHNFGTSATISNISATLSSADSKVVVTNGTHTYANLAADSSDFGNGMYRLQLLAGLRNNDVIPLQLTVTTSDTAMNRTLFVMLPVASIQLNYISSTISPAFNPGSSSDISVTVRNIGAVAPGLTDATLISYSPFVSVNVPSATFTNLPIGTNVSNPTGQLFHISANVRTMRGTIATLGVAFEAGAVRDTVRFTVQIGTRTSRDPCGPDAYGYLAYDDTDTGYTMHPTYSWQNIETTGNRLNLNDASEGSDQTILYRLPFRAKYYGIEYDTIMICTNGWIAFGVSRQCDSTGFPGQYQSHLYDNIRPSHLPNHEGPRNLVAVDWQDLTIAGFPQGVFARNDTTNGWFVISWKGTNVISPGPFPNDVQILILDPVRWPTPTGDCMLIFQYKDFYGGVSGYPPEINYSVIGITDSTMNRALEYSFWDNFIDGAATIPLQQNVNRAIMFTTAQRFITGTLTGTVRRASDNTPIRNTNVFLLNGGNSSVTDSLGHYTIEDIQIGHYDVRAACFGYNPKVDTITIHEDTTSTLDFTLTAPGLRITLRPQDTTLAPNDSVYALLSDTGQVAELPIYIRNTGNGVLTWNSQLLYGGGFDETDSMWDQVFSFNATEACGGDQQLSGIEFDGVHFWVTGSNNYTIPHHLYKLSRTGDLLATYNCPDSSGLFGWRDLAWDGHYLYGSYSNYIDKIDTSNGHVVQRYLTSINPVRALAIDTAAGVIYFADQASAIYKLRMSDGATIGSLPNPGGSGTSAGGLNGLAWYPNDPNGLYLYAFVRDSASHNYGTRIYGINPINGTTIAMRTLGIPNEKALGLAITPRWDPMLWTVCGVMQSGTTCRVGVYELAFNTVWISYTPHVDTLQSQEGDTVTVHLDSHYMPEGRYRVAIRFNTNSVTGSVNVPVVMFVGTTGIGDRNTVALPKKFALEQNYPNPFNPVTTISFSLPNPSPVKLTVHNALGQEVARLVSEHTVQAGTHSITFNGTRLGSGVYFYRLEAGKFVSTRKMVLLK